MKSSIKGLVVILVIVMSFAFLQAVWADEYTVAGTIERIGEGSIDVANDTFYHIPFTDLENANIYLTVGDTVTITAYIVAFPNGAVKYIANSITFGDKTYDWHPNVPKVGTTVLDSTMAVLSDSCSCDNCYCYCPEDCQEDCSCDCLCECNCDGGGPYGPKNDSGNN